MIHASAYAATMTKKPDRIEDLPEFQANEHLIGQAIHMGDASRKYGIPHPTLSRWAKKGFIPVLGKDGQKTLLDEGYVAYCATVYKNNPGQGKRIFDKDGFPYYLN